MFTNTRYFIDKLYQQRCDITELYTQIHQLEKNTDTSENIHKTVIAWLETTTSQQRKILRSRLNLS